MGKKYKTIIILLVMLLIPIPRCAVANTITIDTKVMMS